MDYFIIGTAGHVDHGKTELIKSLTGVDTDRLKEEKERGISIELGFAHLKLPSGREAGIVDVPGHERFIKNMLAGVGGVDMVLLVVAADEGVMPQTREHMDILEILQVKRGVVVITKKDLVDKEWMELVREEVKEFLSNTSLKNAPICEVSSVSGEGLDNLLQVIDKIAGSLEPKKTNGPVRLPVDRAFIVTGFGTVVTGTLVTGTIKSGDIVEIQPEKIRARVRSLQVHGKNVNRVETGKRVAINLSGVDVSQINRGSIVCTPGSCEPSRRMDVRLQLLLNVKRALKNRTRIRFHIGTSEIMGRVVLLDRQELAPGDEAYAQLQLEKHAVAVKGDYFVIRSYSPIHTIGGGRVIDPNAPKHKRYKEDVLKALSIREKGLPDELILEYLNSQKKMVKLVDAAKAIGLAKGETNEIVSKMQEKDKVKIIPVDEVNYLVSSKLYRLWAERVKQALMNYHNKFPLRQGMPKEELRSRFFPEYNTKQVQSLLASWERDELLDVQEQTVSQKGYAVQPKGRDKKIIEKIKNNILNAGFQPPTWKNILQESKLDENLLQEYLHYLVRTGELVKINEDIYMHSENLKIAGDKIKEFLIKNEKMSIGDARDILKSSRKYILPLVEYFDQVGLTKRVEDDHVLNKKGPEGR